MEQLVLVLEYAPGVELFDAILSKNSFSEEEARPVFVQVLCCQNKTVSSTKDVAVYATELDRPLLNARCWPSF